jgi:hypothetical protein
MSGGLRKKFHVRFSETQRKRNRNGKRDKKQIEKRRRAFAGR